MTNVTEERLCVLIQNDITYIAIENIKKKIGSHYPIQFRKVLQDLNGKNL
jgi:hypothetical protein